MLVLAFETCWAACSAALVRVGPPNAVRGDVEILAAHLQPMKTGQAEALPVMLAEIFAETGLGAKDVDRLAVASGPGSFTGVRIAIAAARALRLVRSAELVTCSSLAVIALAHLNDDGRLENPLAVAMDARNGQTYVQLFADGVLPEDTAPELLSYGDASASIASRLGSATVDLVGTAAAELSGRLQEAGIAAAVLDQNPIPDAKFLACAAQGLRPVSGPLSPVYLRAADAKPQSPGATIERISQ